MSTSLTMKKYSLPNLTNNALFSIRVALLQLVSFIAVTNRLICQLIGKDPTSSKKYVAYPYSGRSRTILPPGRCYISYPITIYNSQDIIKK